MQNNTLSGHVQGTSNKALARGRKLRLPWIAIPGIVRVPFSWGGIGGELDGRKDSGSGGGWDSSPRGVRGVGLLTPDCPSLTSSSMSMGSLLRSGLLFL